MARFKVVVTDYVFESFEPEKEVLKGADAELVVTQSKSLDELKPQVRGAHAILNTYLPGIGKDVFEAAGPSLKVVVRYGIGVDTIDIAEATKRGIMVANVPDYCIEEVADHAVAHLLSLARKITLADRRVRNGEWSLAYCKPMKAITGMTAGIIGLGRIGRAIASRVKAFDTKVIFFDPAIKGDVDGFKNVSLDTLYAESDAIFVQCPANEKTHHLLNKAAFEKMAKKPYVINCARGSIIDTDALVVALEQGKISGAGLDVVEDEKAIVAADHPLKKFENVILTPHSAWLSGAAIKKLQRKAAEEVARVLKGGKPNSLLNPEAVK